MICIDAESDLDDVIPDWTEIIKRFMKSNKKQLVI